MREEKRGKLVFGCRSLQVDAPPSAFIWRLPQFITRRVAAVLAEGEAELDELSAPDQAVEKRARALSLRLN